MAMLVIGIVIGKNISGDSVSTDSLKSKDNPERKTEKKPLYWVAPMDPEYRRDSPGKSPMGMDLIPFYSESDDSGKNMGVKISRVEANNLAIRVADVENKLFSKTIHSVGYIGFNEDQIVHMHSRVEGWVERLRIKAIGDQVSKGELLFELYSPELVNAQKEYLTALRSGQSGLIRASNERLKYLGMAPLDIEKLKRNKVVNERLKVLAPMNGVITEIKIGEGAFIMPKTAIMSIADLSKVWINADVFQREVNFIKVGQKAEINVEGFTDKDWSGKVDYIYPTLNARSRTLRVRIVVDNIMGDLKPNMFANIALKAADIQAIQVPKEALIRGRINRVIVQTDNEHYLVVAVRPGRESDEMVEILFGLDGSERVVVSSQFLIDSESNLQAALERLQDKENRSNYKEMKMGEIKKEDDKKGGLE